MVAIKNFSDAVTKFLDNLLQKQISTRQASTSAAKIDTPKDQADDDSLDELLLVKKERNGYKCMICGYSSRNWLKVNIHAKEHKCKICNLQFDSAASVKAHWESNLRMKDHLQRCSLTARKAVKSR